MKDDKNVEQVFTQLATTFQTRDKDEMVVEQMAGGGQPILIADTGLGLSGQNKNNKKRKGNMKFKNACAIL